MLIPQTLQFRQVKGHSALCAVFDIVEQLLIQMIESEAYAKRLTDMLELWKSWTENSGMRREHFDAVKNDLEAFSYGSVVLELVRSSSATGQGNVVSDLQHWGGPGARDVESLTSGPANANPTAAARMIADFLVLHTMETRCGRAGTVRVWKGK